MDEKNLVSVKILKWVGEYQPGQVIKVSEAKAKILCKVSKVHNGHELVDHQKAMLLSDAEKLASTEVDVSKLTQKDMADLGLKNIVHTPMTSDDAHDEYAEAIGASKKNKGGKSKAGQKDAQKMIDSGEAEIPPEAVVDAPPDAKDEQDQE